MTDDAPVTARQMKRLLEESFEGSVQQEGEGCAISAACRHEPEPATTTAQPDVEASDGGGGQEDVRIVAVAQSAQAVDKMIDDALKTKTLQEGWHKDSSTSLSTTRRCSGGTI